jgi:hypothetical protein
MFRWLRKRRERQQKEAAERRAQLLRKAQIGNVNVPDSMRQPHRYPEAEVIPFYMTLAPDQPDDLAAIVALEDAPFTGHRTYTAAAEYAPVKAEQEFPHSLQIIGGGGGTGFGNVGGSGGSGRHNVTQHHYCDGDNIGGSVHHASNHDSHSIHDYSSGSSYDSSSYDSGGSSSGDSSW